MRNHKNILNFSQRRLTMKTLLLFLFMFAVMGIQTMAQPKIDRNAGKVNARVKKAIADKAAIDKILNAKVTKIDLYFTQLPVSLITS